LFLVDPILGDTDAEAEAHAAARADLTDEGVKDAMAGMSYISGFDFSTLDPDQPVPHFESNGHQSLVDAFHRQSAGKTLRQVLTERSSQRSVRLVGAPATVADQMVAAMEHSGGDGFLVSSPVTRRNLTLIADGLCPELRRRGAIRSSYTGAHFRANLTAY
jgi:alkanesulfonate monooxygenase SsuD/methylene tetrahydromethanopterin reductase-like flavin-dependent oxidoreductase (luciferase family)